MADYVRARITAAKIGVGLTLAGVLAGVVERVRPQAPAEPVRLTAKDGAVTAAQKTVAGELVNAIGSAQIKNHSLLYKDIKKHQVLPYSELKDIKHLQNKTKTLTSEAKAFKLSLAALKAGLAGVYDKAQSNAKFLTKTGTAANSSKLGGLTKADLVNGHGSVYTGVQHVLEGDDPKTLLTVPGVVTVQGNAYGGADDEIYLTNLTGSDMTVTWDDGIVEDGGAYEHQATIGSDVFTAVSFSHSGSLTTPLITAQLLTSTGRAITLTVSFVQDTAGASANDGRFVAQALAGP
jgi:hypothetical protein